MRPVQDQQDRDRTAGDPGQGAARTLAEYGVGGEQQALLTALADPRGGFGWHRDYASVLPGAWQDYLALETAATEIAAYEAQRVPGLLQTPAYARALAETDPALDDDAARDRAAEAVLARQQAILGEHRPEVRLVIGQAALHQQVGSEAVMDEQLAALARAAGDSGTVTVQVLPFESGAHAAAGDGSLAILRFTGAPGWGWCTWAASAAGCAWRARTTSGRTRGSSSSCGRSRRARRSPRSCCAAWSATDTTQGRCSRQRRGTGLGLRAAGPVKSALGRIALGRPTIDFSFQVSHWIYHRDIGSAVAPP